MFLTHFNEDKKTYEVEISNNCMLYVWTDSEVRMDYNRTITSDRHFISGFVVDALAEYENTGLTPDEIKNLTRFYKKIIKNILGNIISC